jgi:hypothetical protein
VEGELHRDAGKLAVLCEEEGKPQDAGLVVVTGSHTTCLMW